MIFGDPYKFAIQLDFVDDWVSRWGETMKNEGVFHYIIGGYIQPTELMNQSVTILSAINSLKVKKSNINRISTEDLYDQVSKDAFQILESILSKILNGDETDEEYEIYISTHLNIEENMFGNQNNWIISNDQNEKIIFRNYKNELYEIILDKGYCSEVIDNVLVWARNYFTEECWI